MLALAGYRSAWLILLTGLVVLAVVTQPVAAQPDTEPAVVAEVQADGSAEISVRSTFDLTTDAEQEAFETLINDEEARADARDRFLDRMRAVASAAQEATGREMHVSDATIDLRQSADGDTGIVTLSVTWQGLAAMDGDTLVITEPFASGFTADRQVVLKGPDGYHISSATPEPATSDEARATWSAGTDLSGFAVELQPTGAKSSVGSEPPADEDETRTGGQPGFGVKVAVLAVVAAAVAVGVRREPS